MFNAQKAKKNQQPDYVLSAIAQLDFESTLAAQPLTIAEPGRVDWKVRRDEDGRPIVSGVLEISVDMYFSEEPTDDEDARIERVVIDGKRIFDARTKEEITQDKYFGIDVDNARAQSFMRYRSNMDS